MFSQTRPSFNTSEIMAIGSNEIGQCGFGAKPESSINNFHLKKKYKEYKKYPTPKFFNYNIRITSISCGFNHTAFLVDEHLVYTFGSNQYGKLGISDPHTEFSSSPCLLESLTNFVIKKVACGSHHTSALTFEGEIFAWGKGDEGQLGIGETPSFVCTPVQLSLQELKTKYDFQNFEDISCGEKHTVALSEHGLCFSWGCSEYGQLGNGKKENEITPTILPFSNKKHIKSVACGYTHTLFLTKNKSIYATGSNTHGELGIGNNDAFAYLPAKISKIKKENIVSIHASNYSAALTEKGDLFIWGTGTFGEYFTPQKLNTPKEKFTDICIGYNFGFAIDLNCKLFCWGDNQCGQLGFGDFDIKESLKENPNINGKKINKLACGGLHMMALLEDTKNLEKRNILNNIMNDMTTSKKKQPEDISISNRKISVNNCTETKNKNNLPKENWKGNETINETVKLKNLFNQEEKKQLDYDNHEYVQKNNKTSPLLDNSMEIQNLGSKNENEDEPINISKNKSNGLEFKIKIKEYEDCIKLLEMKEKKSRMKVKELEKIHNEKYHYLAGKYNEIKEDNDKLKDEIMRSNDKLEKEIYEKKKMEDKIRLYLKEKSELKAIFQQQSLDIQTIHDSLSLIANDMEQKDKDLIKLYNLKEKDKSMIKLLRSQLEETIMKLDTLENKKQNSLISETENYKKNLEKKDKEINSLKLELEDLYNTNKGQTLNFQNLLHQKEMENDQMKTIIFELNTHNKFLKSELDKKSLIKSPEFQQEIRETSEFNQTNSNLSQDEGSHRMEINELDISNGYEQLEQIEIQSPQLNLVTPTEQKTRLFATQFGLNNNNNSLNSFGEKNHENDVSLNDSNEKNILNNNNNHINMIFNEKNGDTNVKKNNFVKKMKRTPSKMNETEKENAFSKNSTERNDGLLESISSSVYEKIVLSNKSLNNIKSRLTDLQKNRGALEERMKDFESKLTV